MGKETDPSDDSRVKRKYAMQKLSVLALILVSDGVLVGVVPAEDTEATGPGGTCSTGIWAARASALCDYR